MSRKIISLFVLLFVMNLAGCGKSGKGSRVALSERQIEVVTTTGMIGDMAVNVGGERVNVTALMGPGIDPHLYKASEGDVTALVKADIVFFNGLHLEGKMAEVLEKMSGRTKTVAVGEKIPVESLLSPPEFKGAHDPHIWFDVSLWLVALQAMRDGFMELDPEHEEIYRSNAAKYEAELVQLDNYIKEKTSELQEEMRVVITAHDAFNYFGKAYGFEVRGLQGISTASEAGTGDVQELASFIVERRIPAIFVESSIPVRTIEAVQAAVKAKNIEVKIGGELYSDALGNPETAEGNYIGMFRHNIDTIVNALSIKN
ncbi:MAG: zinc ABC transporter substrate-binding protein [Candidatus Electryonea clarkiae]|nr:zinc ABC transporter substrate-binding protein [Candidatus Electryonea clarkiae]MDP8285670.1 zinc ABC transporter substrate-binding protein [Candidatus Electryonea clarkiae]